MPISNSTPPAPPSKITVLGSGSYTTTGFGAPAWEDAGNFSTTGDIGNGVIVIEISTDKGTATLCQWGIDDRSGATIRANQTVASSYTEAFVKLKQNPNDPTGSRMMRTDDTAIVITGPTTFAFNAAETIYLKFSGTVASGAKMSWIAYLIKA